jgi:hypothetical protein
MPAELVDKLFEKNIIVENDMKTLIILIVTFCSFCFTSCLSNKAAAIIYVTSETLNALPSSDLVEIQIANRTKETIVVLSEDRTYGYIGKNKTKNIKAPRDTEIRLIGGTSKFTYGIISCGSSGEYYEIKQNINNNINKNIDPREYGDPNDPNSEYAKKKKKAEELNRSLGFIK